MLKGDVARGRWHRVGLMGDLVPSMECHVLKHMAQYRRWHISVDTSFDVSLPTDGTVPSMAHIRPNG